MNQLDDMAGERVETEQRVSVVVGDRLCIKCGFNLAGQTVLREPHYQMFIVRCPECSTVASLQEYPLLGRWQQRWARMLMGLWVIVLVTVAIFGSVIVVTQTEVMGSPLQEQIAPLFKQESQEWIKTNKPDEMTQQQQLGFYWGALDEDWIAAEEWRSGFKNAGGWNALLGPFSLVWGLLFGLFTVGLGIFWAVTLPHWSRRGLALFLIGQAAFGSLWVLLGRAIEANAINGALTGVPGADVEAWGLAFYLIAVPSLLVSLPVFLVAILLGACTGRPMARFTVRLLLPPRLRGPLAGLWLCDGLEPPATR